MIQACILISINLVISQCSPPGYAAYFSKNSHLPSSYWTQGLSTCTTYPNDGSIVPGSPERKFNGKASLTLCYSIAMNRKFVTLAVCFDYNLSERCRGEDIEPTCLRSIHSLHIHALTFSSNHSPIISMYSSSSTRIFQLCRNRYSFWGSTIPPSTNTNHSHTTPKPNYNYYSS